MSGDLRSRVEQELACHMGWVADLPDAVDHIVAFVEVEQAKERERCARAIEHYRDRAFGSTATRWVSAPEWFAWGKRLMDRAANIARKGEP